MIEYLHVSCISFISLSIRTRFDSSAAAGSHVATTRRRFTAYVQAGHMITMCTISFQVHAQDPKAQYAHVHTTRAGVQIQI